MKGEIIFDNQYAKATFEAEKNLVRFQYFESSANMLERDYKDLFINYSDVLVKLYEDKIVGEKSVVYLSDIREMKYTVAPELQEWTDQEIITKIAVFSKKSAIILPTDLFASVSAQMVIEEENTSKIPAQYFENEEEALAWLL